MAAAAAERGSGGNRSFAMACSLLSQLVKEKQQTMAAAAAVAACGASDVSSQRIPATMRLMPGADVEEDEAANQQLDVSEMEEENESSATMELFPQHAGHGDLRETEKQPQLTIFYGGKVLVFDNFPAEKAHELMEFAAGKDTTPASLMNHSVHIPLSSNSFVPTLPAGSQEQPIAQVQSEILYTDLPMARKASLQRFFVKRKDRMAAFATSPYMKNSSVSPAVIKKECVNLGLRWSQLA